MSTLLNADGYSKEASRIMDAAPDNAEVPPSSTQLVVWRMLAGVFLVACGTTGIGIGLTFLWMLADIALSTSPYAGDGGAVGFLLMFIVAALPPGLAVTYCGYRILPVRQESFPSERRAAWSAGYTALPPMTIGLYPLIAHLGGNWLDDAFTSLVIVLAILLITYPVVLVKARCTPHPYHRRPPQSTLRVARYTLIGLGVTAGVCSAVVDPAWSPGFISQALLLALLAAQVDRARSHNLRPV